MSGRPLSQWTDEELLAAAKRLAAGGEEKPSATFGETMADIGTQAGAGLVDAATGVAGFPGDIQSGATRGVEWMTGRSINDPSLTDPNLPKPTQFPTSAALQKRVEEFTGPIPPPQTGPGKLMRTTTGMAPAALFPARSMLQRGINVVAPAAGAEAGEAVGKKLDSPNLGRFLGTAAGGVAGVRGLTPTANPRPEYQALTNVLQQEGVSLTAGRLRGSKNLMMLEDVAGDQFGVGGHAARLNEATHRGYTGAVAERIGAPGQLFTPEMVQREMGSARTGPRGRVPQMFEDISNRNTLTPDPQLPTALAAVRTRYDTHTLPSHRAGGAKDIDNIIDEVIGTIQQNNGVIPGPVYQSLRSKIGALADGVTDAPGQGELARALNGIQRALDDNFMRSIPAADQALLQTARRQYANWKSIQPSMSASALTAEGYVSPQRLATTVRNRDPNAFDVGHGDLAMLARAGEILRPLPQSGTAPRTQAGNILSLGLGTGGFLASGGNPVVAAALMALPSATGRTLLSRPVQRYLSNDYAIQQALGTPPLPGDARRAALLDAILGMQRGENK